MAFGTHIRTFFEGRWHEGDIPVMRAADHGIWQGSSVFDGARWFEGVTPDLDRHAARLNHSAEAMLITPLLTGEEIAAIAQEGLHAYARDEAVYVRPMYWALDGDRLGVAPNPDSTAFCLCLEAVPMPGPEVTTRLTLSSFRRPVLADAVCNAKAGALYPNNARMLREAQARGYGNAVSLDALGNVAETATANLFIVKDGVLRTPIANGTFLSGITRARHIANARAAGIPVEEAVLTPRDLHEADEVFLSGNFAKVTGVSEFDGTLYRSSAITARMRQLYWDWAHSA